MKLLFLILNLQYHLSNQDIYLHNPRGSNNRLNEKSAQRTNNDRLFDSQNNARGGYNVGDATNQPFKSESEQFQMKYYQSSPSADSVLLVEWTAQHGCGSRDHRNEEAKVNCDLILQYMCQEEMVVTNLDRMRDGIDIGVQGYTQMVGDSKAEYLERKNSNVDGKKGLMESWESYDACNYRERNMGVFIADQNLKKNNKGYTSAIYTRQNPNGNRRGYECPEERDYFPYWHPTSWKDIAILTSNKTLCSYFRKESFNTRPRHLCIEAYTTSAGGGYKHWSRWNNQVDCVKNGGTWQEFYNYLEKDFSIKDGRSCEAKSSLMKWAVPYDSKTMEKECLVMLPSPECEEAEFTRSNHLGNTKKGNAPQYEWKLPYFPSGQKRKCTFRIRYNISTSDFDPYQTDSKFNGPGLSPVQNNPQVNIGANNQPLQLAINTAQTSRVFQDRSHTFYLLARPKQISSSSRIYNLNVRGKRGNIVQTYPAVEYDFIPNRLEITTSDLVHIQWTGSNTHNNAPPGGDGQTGDAGQGLTGSDRSNIVEISDLNENFPLPFEMSNMCGDSQVVGFLNESGQMIDFDGNSLDLGLYLSTSGYYQCLKNGACERSYEIVKPPIDGDLNSAASSLPGVVIRFLKSNKRYFYMCSRNNNFSNRSQKGSINVN